MPVRKPQNPAWLLFIGRTCGFLYIGRRYVGIPFGGFNRNPKRKEDGTRFLAYTSRYDRCVIVRHLLETIHPSLTALDDALTTLTMLSSRRRSGSSPNFPRAFSSVSNELSHFDEHGASRMVDVSQKAATDRLARASGRVSMAAETLRLIRDKQLAKGDVLEVARLAGIMAAKRTGDLIPLCHPLGLEAVSIEFDFPDDRSIEIQATVRVTGRTGVEMEALTAVSVAGLTIYDMCKAVDRQMVIEAIRLEEKSGGRSGHFLREAHA